MKFAIVISLSVFLFFQSIDGQNLQKTRQISYCKVLKLAGEQGKVMVETKAYMTYSTISRVDGGDSFFYLSSCNNEDYFALADFEDLQDSTKLQKALGSLPNEKNFIFEVIFVGELQTSILPLFGHLGWARAEAKVFQLKSIKQVRLPKRKRPDFDAESDLKAKGEYLRVTNYDLLFSLFGAPNNFLDERILSEDFKLTDDQGKIFDRNNYQEFIRENTLDEPARYAVGIELVKIEKNYYQVSGKVSIKSSNEKNKTFKYENLFKFSGDNWVLFKTTLLKCLVNCE